MKVSVLASGSRGNAILLRSGRHSLLMDCGISVRKLKIRLEQMGEELPRLEAIFVSHEHTDHTCGLEHLCEKMPAPVFATEGTWEKMSALNLDAKEKLRCGDKIKLKGFVVQAFRVPHDANEPVGFLIEAEEKKMALVTDLGSVNGLIRERLKGANLVILESNHDPELLRNGRYPWPLKQRILGKYGHLSNQDCASLLTGIQSCGLSWAVLAHLSDDNNTPELAFQTSRELLGGQVKLFLTSQKQAGPKLEI